MSWISKSIIKSTFHDYPWAGGSGPQSESERHVSHVVGMELDLSSRPEDRKELWRRVAHNPFLFKWLSQVLGSVDDRLLTAQELLQIALASWDLNMNGVVDKVSGAKGLTNPDTSSRYYVLGYSRGYRVAARFFTNCRSQPTEYFKHVDKAHLLIRIRWEPWAATKSRGADRAGTRQAVQESSAYSETSKAMEQAAQTMTFEQYQEETKKRVRQSY